MALTMNSVGIPGGFRVNAGVFEKKLGFCAYVMQCLCCDPANQLQEGSFGAFGLECHVPRSVPENGGVWGSVPQDTFFDTLRTPVKHSLGHPRFQGHSRDTPQDIRPRDPCSWQAGSQFLCNLFETDLKTIRDRKGTPRTCATEILPNFRVNFGAICLKTCSIGKCPRIVQRILWCDFFRFGVLLWLWNKLCAVPSYSKLLPV